LINSGRLSKYENLVDLEKDVQQLKGDK
jgi:hypothetical protein